MVNIESLPRLIKVIATGKLYNLQMHVTAWNKLCVCYKLIDKWTTENDKIFHILSNVVEPGMGNDVKYSNNIYDIVDVPIIDWAYNTLSTRLNTAIANGEIEVIH